MAQKKIGTTVLLLDDDKLVTHYNCSVIKKKHPDWTVIPCTEPAAAQKVAEKRGIDVVVSDLNFAGTRDIAAEFLENCAKAGGRIIICSGLTRIPPEFEQVMARKDIVFLEKPQWPEDVLKNVEKLAAMKPKPREPGNIFRKLTSEEFLRQFHIAPPPAKRVMRALANFGKLSPEQKRELMLEMKEQQLGKDMRMRGIWNKRQLNELAGEHLRVRKLLKKPRA